MLYVGRIFSGICQGFCNSLNYIYVLDFCLNFKEKAICGVILALIGNSGTLIIYILGIFLNWRQLAGICVLFGVHFFQTWHHRQLDLFHSLPLLPLLLAEVHLLLVPFQPPLFRKSLRAKLAAELAAGDLQPFDYKSLVQVELRCCFLDCVAVGETQNPVPQVLSQN